MFHLDFQKAFLQNKFHWLQLWINYCSAALSHESVPLKISFNSWRFIVPKTQYCLSTQLLCYLAPYLARGQNFERK